MPCYRPIRAWRSRRKSENGKWPLTFNRSEGYTDKEIKIPCGKCVGCKLEYSKQWATRCMHEASMHENNYFLTLTYDEESVRDSLQPQDLAKFIKRLRKKDGKNAIRYFACGEYGKDKERPHYHALIFNHDFPDKTLHKIRSGERVYRSPTLERLWPYGFSEIGSVTEQSAAYVARYCYKKHRADGARNVDNDRHPEFVRMSRRPAIGEEWLTKYQSDIYNGDAAISAGGIINRPPKYYDRKFDGNLPRRKNELGLKEINEFDLIKHRREKKVAKAIDSWQLRKAEIAKICIVEKYQQRSYESEGNLHDKRQQGERI